MLMVIGYHLSGLSLPISPSPDGEISKGSRDNPQRWNMHYIGPHPYVQRDDGEDNGLPDGWRADLGEVSGAHKQLREGIGNYALLKVDASHVVSTNDIGTRQRHLKLIGSI
jgi:hypothetical protein